MGPLRTIVLRSTGLAWCLGGALAARHLSTVKHVREFQAVTAEPAGAAERISAWFQRTTVETVGFGVVAALAGLVALALARGDRRRTFGTFFCLVGGLWAWVRHGAYYAEELIPFLSPSQLAVLSLVGWGAAGAGALVAAGIARRLPYAKGANEALTGLGAGLVVALGSELWRASVAAPGGSLKSVTSIAILAGVALLAPLVAAPLGALLQPLRSLFPASDGSSRAHWLTGRVLPALVVLTVIVGAGLRASTPALPAPVYPRLASARPAPAADDRAPRNVVFVLIDTLRADALGCYGYERPTSPRIDALAAAGTVFEDVSSPAPWTKPSTASVLTGLWPSRHGALKHGSQLRTPEGMTTLAEEFAGAGFATAGFVSNPNVKADFDFDRGFDEFFDKPVDDTTAQAALRDSIFGRLLIAVTRHQFNWKYANDIFAMNRHVESWLRTNADEDFFLYVHYIDPHTPYAPPARWRREFAQNHDGFPVHNERRQLVGRDLYDAEVRTSDEGLAQILDLLDELGIADETLIAITSDHGEEFNEKGMFEHGYSIYQAEVFVPLILNGPTVAAQRVDVPVNTVQLPATLLDLAGVRPSGSPPNEPLVFGDAPSLGPWARGGAASEGAKNFVENEFNMGQAPVPDFIHQGIREGSWKLILTEKSRFRPIDTYPFEELYDLATDPGETRNLFYDEEQEDRVERMMGRLKAHRTFLESMGLRDGATKDLSADELEMLRMLGYLEDE
ncbi:Choline-sulfatase [Planctomycetes bacterium Pla163]|uniref:Choline-sulfatase n=1 Tax=Rohdeia mirabilis TaxID=2528008 RepID=A0A518CZ24_9BACT|nr:Choline-sulfatase [Planctomycetes bacterium Pla163]